jgi:hypothetical protein
MAKRRAKADTIAPRDAEFWVITLPYNDGPGRFVAHWGDDDAAAVFRYPSDAQRVAQTMGGTLDDVRVERVTMQFE